MRICLVSPEVFAWGYHGGFGFLTRTIGREFAHRGHEVFVVTPKRGSQGEVERLDGMTVYGFPDHEGKSRALRSFLSRLDSMGYYRKTDAEIYHSEAISYNTLAAQMAMPHRPHIITFQDPYDLDEWKKIAQVDPRYRLTPSFRWRLAIENIVLSMACRGAASLHAQAKFLIPKARRLFRLVRDPTFLPNPVVVPQRLMRKSATPTVCFLARWDPQKRVEIFLRLAQEFPEVEFVAMGRSHDTATDARLRRKYGGARNLTCTGFVSEEEKSSILERSWTLVNTSIREALPVSFLEALAHETPILSGEDPDGLTSSFGYRVRDDDYGKGLMDLLKGGGWMERGRLGRRYVEEVHEVGKVVDRHIEIYEGVLESHR